MKNEARIKDWQLITLAQKNDLTCMRELKALYEKTFENCSQYKDYVRVCDQVTKLENKLSLEIILAEKKLEAAKNKEQYTLKRNASLLEIGELITEYNIWQAGTGALLWYLQEKHQNEYGARVWSCLKTETLKARFPQLNNYIRGTDGLADHSSYIDFTSQVVNEDRIFNKLVQSWTQKTGNGTLNIIHSNFCVPHETESNYHWIMDAVMESITGGNDQDNLEHMQKILIGKYLHPENIFLPNIFCNDAGTTGKGLLAARFLTRLFGGSVADNCNIEHLTGKFNGAIAGKAIICVNETSRDKVDQEKLKAFLGSPTFKVEEKYEKAFDADNCGLVFCSANGSTGGVTLSGEGSDRRFSIFSSKTNIYKVVVKYFAAEENRVISENDARIWIESTGQNILHDTLEVSKWIHAMILKYGDVKEVKAIKNKAYQDLIDRQRGAWTQTVEDVFEDPTFTYIREWLLRDLILHVNKGEMIPGKNRMREEIERLIKDRGLSVVWRNRVSIGKHDIRRTVWKKDDGSNYGTGTVKEDETKYGHTDTNGRWIWDWVA